MRNIQEEAYNRVAHVVMIDDDKDDLTLTKSSFQKSVFPFKFTGFSAAENLFSEIENGGVDDIDILLIDLNMPVMGGLDTLKTFRQRFKTDNIKIFMFSSSKSNIDRKECVNAGADGYLFKPSGTYETQRFVNTISLASEFWV